MTPRKTEYERLEQRAARGEFQLVVPFDFLILEHLPEIGTLFAGMYPLGETTANIQKVFNQNISKKEEQLPVGMVMGRLRSLEQQGLASQTRGARSKRVWQRTEKGTKMYKEWKEKQSSGVSQSGSNTSK